MESSKIVWSTILVQVVENPVVSSLVNVLSMLSNLWIRCGLKIQHGNACVRWIFPYLRVCNCPEGSLYGTCHKCLKGAWMDCSAMAGKVRHDSEAVDVWQAEGAARAGCFYLVIMLWMVLRCVLQRRCCLVENCQVFSGDLSDAAKVERILVRSFLDDGRARPKFRDQAPQPNSEIGVIYGPITWVKQCVDFSWNSAESEQRVRDPQL
jgi:hypothetical protein